MNFGSKFVYMYDQSDSEEIDEDDYVQGLSSGSDEEARAKPTRSLFSFGDKLRSHKQKKSVKRQQRKVRKADTNIISIGFQTLVAPNYMHTGDATRCKSCTGILNNLSTVEDLDDFEKKWICEFCSQENVLNIVDEEIPKDNDTTYMLQPAPSTAQMTVDGDTSMIIFCIDISGSMCVTKEVPGKLKFRGNNTSSLESFMDDPREPQYLPKEKRNVTWVSRLQGVQAAIDNQLTDMEAKHPNRKVALVTFNNEVTLVGDKPEQTVHISGDKLSDSDALLQIGKEFPEPDVIKNKCKQLSSALFELEANGRTALGPAIMTSLGLASKSPRSKIILCTDGKANIGCGNVEEDKEEESSTFYEKAGIFAKDMGISISVITIEGTDCNLSKIGRLAHETEGDIDIVDPLKLSEEFSNILAVPTIATKVKATLLLHKQLYFRHETNQESQVEKLVGNVTKETEVTFEYGVRPGAKKSFGKSNPGNKSDEEKKLPFQLQIEYTDIEGARALRVITEFKPITMEREKAESKMRWSTVGSHIPQQCSKFALDETPEKARLSNIAYMRMMNRNKSQEEQSYLKFKSLSKPVDKACKELCSSKAVNDAQSRVLYGASKGKFRHFWKGRRGNKSTKAKGGAMADIKDDADDDDEDDGSDISNKSDKGATGDK